MDRLWFPSAAELSGPQLHLLFLAIMGIAAVVLGSATAWVVVRKPTSNTNHTLTRSLGLVSTLMISLGLWLALDTIVFGPEPATAELRQILGTQLTFVTTTALVLGATAAAPRSAVLMASIHGMAGLGMLVYTLLLSAVPPSVDPTWELEHLLEFGLFSTAGFSMLLAAGLLTSRQHRPTTLSAYALTAAIGLLVVTQIHLIHPEPRLSVLLPTYGALLGSIVWVGQAMSGKMPNLRRQAERAWEHPV
ncbi:MAG: hypothetical protein AAFS10_12645, partial [Myxococcota bacterium]